MWFNGKQKKDLVLSNETLRDGYFKMMRRVVMRVRKDTDKHSKFFGGETYCDYLRSELLEILLRLPDKATFEALAGPLRSALHLKELDGTHAASNILYICEQTLDHLFFTEEEYETFVNYLKYKTVPLTWTKKERACFALPGVPAYEEAKKVVHHCMLQDLQLELVRARKGAFKYIKEPEQCEKAISYYTEKYGKVIGIREQLPERTYEPPNPNFTLEGYLAVKFPDIPPFVDSPRNSICFSGRRWEDRVRRSREREEEEREKKKEQEKKEKGKEKEAK